MTPDGGQPAPELAALLERHRPRLVRFFERKGRGLRRFEAAEDLAQGVHLHALVHLGRFEYQGERAFVSWLLRLARQHLGRRIDHWTALKRNAGPMLRITFGVRTTGAGGRTGGVQPAADEPGPATHASLREEVDLAVLALDGLPERDRDLVRMMSDDLSVREVAERLGVSESAAQRARLRAVDRFRKIYTILLRDRGRA